MITQTSPVEFDLATQGFAASMVAWCVHHHSRNGTFAADYTAESNVTNLESASGAFANLFEISEPILRPEAAELFSQAAAALESEMTL